MKEKFFANVAFLVGINLLVKPFYIFGIERAAQLKMNNDMGGAVYGDYFALYNLSLIFYIILDLGLADYNKRTIASEPELLPKLLSSFLLTKLGLSLIYFVVAFIAAYVLGYDSEKMHWLFFLGLNQVFISFIFYFRSNLSALFLFRLEGLFQVMDRLLMVLFGAILLWSGLVPILRPEYLIYSLSMAYGITAIACGAVVMYKAGFPRISFDGAIVLKIIREGFPFILITIMMVIYSRFDSIMLERMLPDGDVEANLYATGYRLLDAVQGFALIISSLLMSLFSRMIAQKEKPDELVDVSLRAMMFFTGTTAIASFCFRDEIIVLIGGNAGYEGLVFGMLMLTIVDIGLVYVFGPLMSAAGLLWKLNIMTSVGVVSNLVLNYILIPKLKALGAVEATLITQTVVGILHVWAAIHWLNIKLSLKLFVTILGYFALSFMLFYFAKMLPVSWMLQFLIAAMGSVVIGFSLKMVDIRELLSSFKKAKE